MPQDLLQDRPLDSSDLKRLDPGQRLLPVIDKLSELLCAWVHERGGSREDPPRIGLFAGLGQGKTTVVESALEKVGHDRFLGCAVMSWLRDRVLGPAIVRFDVSYFKADDLEWRFLTAVLWRRTLRNLVLVFLPALTLLAYGLGMVDVVRRWWNLKQCAAQPWVCVQWSLGAELVLVLSLVTLAGPAFRLVRNSVARVTSFVASANPAKALFAGEQDWLIHGLATWMLALPSIVIVDDLDRARVEQQRSFLRALLRFSRRLRFAVVVCMDESEILAAAPDPEAPDELLRKVISVELRLPDRGREDALCLVISLCGELVNQRPHLAGVLRNPRWIGDLLRCLLLMYPSGSISPRRVKRLMNDVLAHADQVGLLPKPASSPAGARRMGVAHTDDLVALLRLDCLLRLAPQLRKHQAALLTSLEANRLAEFDPVLAASGADPQGPGSVRRFFMRTRRLLPVMHDGWYRLLGGSSGVTLEPQTDSEWPFDRLPLWRLGARSIDLYRTLFASIADIARGHPVSVLPVPDSLLRQDQEDAGRRRLGFVIGMGGMERFQEGELPSELFDRDRNELAAHMWPVWLGALAEAEAEQRGRLYVAADAFFRQLADEGRNAADPDGGTCAAAARELLLRELLADTEVWRSLPLTERKRLMRDCIDGQMPAPTGADTGLTAPRTAVEPAALPADSAWLFRRVLHIELQPDDLPMALACLGQAQRVDGRLAFAWMRNVADMPADVQLAAWIGAAQALAGSGQSTGTLRAVDHIRRAWPAPRQEGALASGWVEVLTRWASSFELWSASGTVPLPDAVNAAWRLWSGPWLGGVDCLRVIRAAAMPEWPTGTRWSLAAVEEWLSSRRLPQGLRPGHEGLPPGLRTLCDEEGLRLDRAVPDDSEATLDDGLKLAALSVAVVLGWRLGWRLGGDFQAVRGPRLLLVLDALMLGGGQGLVRLADRQLLHLLLHNAGRPNSAQLAYWQEAIDANYGADAQQLFSELGWPPYIVWSNWQYN